MPKSDDPKYQPEGEITVYKDSSLRLWTTSATIASRWTRFLGKPTEIHNGGMVMWNLETKNGLTFEQLGVVAELMHGWFIPTEGVSPPCYQCGCIRRGAQ